MLVKEITERMSEDQWVEITVMLAGNYLSWGAYYANEVPPELLERNVLAIEMEIRDKMPNRYDSDLGEEMCLELYVEGSEEEACT